MSKIILTSGASPSTPISGTVALYSDANDTLRFKNDAGTDVGIVTVSVGGITTLDKLQFEDHGSNAQMWLIEEDSNSPTNALVFDYSGTERLRIMPSGDFADSSNNVVLSFSSTNELGANWVDVRNTPTGSGPIVRSVGADTNIDLVLDTKGTGDIDVSSNKLVNVTDPTLAQDAATKNYVDNNHGLDNVIEDTTPQLGGNLDHNGFSITTDGSVVLSFATSGEAAANWVDIKHAQTGFGPIIRSVGSDTNIDLNISAKGTGIVNLGSGGVKLNAPLDVNSQPFTNISSFSKDGAVIISFTSFGEFAVNWVDINNTNTGFGPIVRSVGADTNIDLVFDTKGTGDIDVSTNKIINVVNPTLAQDAATKNYVDTEIAAIPAPIPAFRVDPGSVTIVPSDRIVVLTGAGIGQPVALPPVGAVPAGTTFTLKNGVGSTGSIITPDGADTIDAVGGANAGLLAAPLAFTRLISDAGINWYVA